MIRNHVKEGNLADDLGLHNHLGAFRDDCKLCQKQRPQLEAMKKQLAKKASLTARADFLGEKNAAVPWHEAIDLAGLGLIAAPVVTQMAAPEFYDEHETAMHGTDLAGLALLMGTTGHKLISPS